MHYLAVTILVLTWLVGWAMTVFGLPGNWLIFGAAALYAWLLPTEGRTAIGSTTLIFLFGMAVIGEVVELLASALGVKRLGGSRRGAVLAILGSLVGATLGGSLGVPVPVLGPVVGVVLGAAIGALGGALVGELWKGRTLDQSVAVGHAAFWGRLFGSVAKIAIGSAMLVIAFAALLIQ